MKIIFMGTPDFALYSLEAITSQPDNEIIAVLTQADKPKGRGYVLTPSPVKVWALEHNIPVYQPATLRDGAFEETLHQLDPDLIIVTAYGKILPEYVLNYPKHGCINVHTSLLPRHRGAAPMQRAILAGDKVTGVSIQMMDVGIDTGDVLLFREIPIGPDDNLETVHDNLGAASREHLTEICGLCFEMNRKSDFLSLEREGLTKLFLESVKERHMVSYPFYLESAVLPKLWISDFTCHVFCCFSIESAAKIGIFSHKRRHLTTITAF